MERGTDFVVTLERAGRSITLGTVTAEGDGEEAGFTAVFTIPSGIAAGSYAVRAAAKDGAFAVADLTVTEHAKTPGSTEAAEPSGATRTLARPKPPLEAGGAAALAVAFAVIGIILVRRMD